MPGQSPGPPQTWKRGFYGVKYLWVILYDILNFVLHVLGSSFPESSTSHYGARSPARPRGGVEPHPGNKVEMVLCAQMLRLHGCESCPCSLRQVLTATPLVPLVREQGAMCVGWPVLLRLPGGHVNGLLYNMKKKSLFQITWEHKSG